MHAPFPSRISNCNVYYDNQLVVGTAELQMPNIEYVTEEISGPGIAGSVELPIPGHTKPLEASVKFNIPTTQQFDMASAMAKGLTFRGAGLVYDAATGGPVYTSITVSMRGIAKGVDLGKMVPGQASDGGTPFAILYLKVVIDNKVVCEIDKLNSIHAINGVDQLAAVNKMI